MSQDIDDLISRLEKEHLPSKPSKRSYLPRWVATSSGRLKNTVSVYVGHHRRGVAMTAGIGALCLALAGGAFYFLAVDFVTKRQAYPIRNVLYQSQETVFFTGGQDTDKSKRDRKSETVIEKGSSDGTKLGDLIGVAKIRRSDEQDNYEWEEANKTRIAYASEKREPVQAGLRLSGSIDFREQYAEIIGQPGNFIAYSFIPERGRRNIQLNVLVDRSGQRTLVNELITYRSFPLGWMLGDRFRDRAEIHEFADTQNNRKLMDNLFALINNYDNNKNLSKVEREALVMQMLEIEQQLEKLPMIVSHEDGFLKILPQESTTLLFSNPNTIDRIRMAIGGRQAGVVKNPQPTYPSLDYFIKLGPLYIHNPNGDFVRLRVENSWDLWPGNYWLLNKFAIGKHPNVLRPFAHYNNGGYTIRDAHGEVARIKIQDFWIHYGHDVVYNYFLDKNGNGKIDERTELIGQVLYRISQDEVGKLEQVVQTQQKADVTKRYIYSFMAGHDWARRMEEFYLCNTIESFIINEINRGFSLHSEIGWINMQRSNILLIEARNVANLARALTPESTLVAKWDIVALLRAAGRDYVNRYVVETPSN